MKYFLYKKTKEKMVLNVFRKMISLVDIHQINMDIGRL